MALPQPVIDFLTNSALFNGADPPTDTQDLFATGALDSFALVDFITVIEEHCGISVPDADVVPANFRTMESIDRFVQTRLSLT